MNDGQLERLAELLECDADFGSICAALIDRNRERDRMRKTIGELRGRRDELELLRAFARNIRDNFDCDADGHKYGTYCRRCDAAKALNERSDHAH